jgi:hypothetical protein
LSSVMINQHLTSWVMAWPTKLSNSPKNSFWWKASRVNLSQIFSVLKIRKVPDLRKWIVLQPYA